MTKAIATPSAAIAMTKVARAATASRDQVRAPVQGSGVGSDLPAKLVEDAREGGDQLRGGGVVAVDTQGVEL